MLCGHRRFNLRTDDTLHRSSHTQQRGRPDSEALIKLPNSIMPASNTIRSCPVPSLSLIPFTIAPALEVSELDHIWRLTPTMSASSCYVCFLRIGKLLNLRLHIIFHVPHNFTFSIFDPRAEKNEQIQQAAFMFARVTRDAD